MKKMSFAAALSVAFFLMRPLPWVPLQSGSLSQPLIIDHTCTDIDLVPEFWINKAKTDFRMAYGHTSHGSQIVSGMEVLMLRSDLYAFDHDGTDGALSLHDGTPSGDLGNPNRTEWYYRTRNLLNEPDCNRTLIMWSWCGQVSTASQNDINTYLNLMDSLEQEFPQVTFVYMTGHLDGTGEGGNLHRRNEQIRDYCRQNNKVLFDFADIESYDPDGNYFLDKGANDACDYDSNGDGIRDANWADQWCASHPGECSSCSCAHSHSLNCDLKGKAFWWMIAKLAGWEAQGCDYNSDGTVDRLDLIAKHEDLSQEMDDWVRDCWDTGDDCADINGDGRVDENDLREKQRQVSQELAEWMGNCGFSKKGGIKR